MKHKENDYKCPILSANCPFNNKQFIKKIKFGQQKHKEFMDEMMETVISDLKKPMETGPSLRNIISKHLICTLVGIIIYFQASLQAYYPTKFYPI